MLSLSEIASSRNAKQIPILFLDGLYDKLDVATAEQIMDLLHEEQFRKESLFVTTLDPTLSTFFQNKIVVEKQGRASVIFEQ